MTHAVELRPEELGEGCRPTIQRLGRRQARLVYQADETKVAHIDDPSSGLPLFPIEEVFLDRNSVLIACGSPNAAISLYREDGPKGPGWYKFAAFMFWRQKSYIANTKGRLQSGLYLELRNLSQQTRDDIWFFMNQLSGKRGPSCAKLNAEVLARAGFTLGNERSLRTAVRPSKYTSLFWRHGILLNGQRVDTRIVLTGDHGGVHEHMKGAWFKEVSSPQRTVQKTYRKHDDHAPAPTFPIREIAEIDKNRWSGYPTTIGINRPSRLGANLTFAFGQQPVYTVRLDGIDQVPELRTPLTAYPGKLDAVTKIKKYVLFSRPVIGTIRYFRHRSVDYFDGIPSRAAIEMLMPSAGPDHDTAVLYNCVVTLTSDGCAEARITPLKNQDPRSQDDKVVQRINWILAKHVLVSGYDPATVYACEAWVYFDRGEPVLCLNDNSGTYKPDVERLIALADYLQELFGIRVEIYPMGGAA